MVMFCNISNVPFYHLPYEERLRCDKDGGQLLKSFERLDDFKIYVHGDWSRVSCVCVQN